VALSWYVVPTLVWTQAPGSAAARVCCARHPVQWPGTISSGGELGERGHGRGNDRLERGAGQVEAADDGEQPVHAGQAHGVPDDVDYPGVAAPGDDDQAPAVHIDHERLIVNDDGVVLPAVPVPGLVLRRHAMLELSDAGPPRR
jgi:hypothetical protein